jgi:hypothetical protein
MNCLIQTGPLPKFKLRHYQRAASIDALQRVFPGSTFGEMRDSDSDAFHGLGEIEKGLEAIAGFGRFMAISIARDDRDDGIQDQHRHIANRLGLFDEARQIGRRIEGPQFAAWLFHLANEVDAGCPDQYIATRRPCSVRPHFPRMTPPPRMTTL